MKHLKGCLWIVFLIVAGAALALLVYVRATQTEAVSSLEDIERREGLSVTTVKPVSRDFTSYLYCDGQVGAASRYFLRSRVAEVANEVLVDAGDVVEKGQLLAAFRREDLQARVDARRAAYEEAEKNYERYENLLERGVVSADVVDARRTSRESAAAALRQAETELKYTEVHSPAGESGRGAGSVQVAERFVDPGEFKGIGDALFTLIDLSRVEVRVNVPAGGIGALDADQELDFRLENETRWRRGTVRRISPSTESPNRFFEVYLTVDNERKGGVWQMRPGMHIEVRIPVERVREARALPASAIAWERNRQYVFVVREATEEVALPAQNDDSSVAGFSGWIGSDEDAPDETGESAAPPNPTHKVLRAHRVEVATGLRREGYVQIRGDAVSADDRVVCSPRVDLEDDSRVKISAESCPEIQGEDQ